MGFQRKSTFLGEFLICESLIYTMDHPYFIVSNFMENPIGLKRVKNAKLLFVFVYLININL